MPSKPATTVRCLAALGLVALTAACNDHPVKPTEYESLSQQSDTVAVPVNKDVDILFVIDNSGSMGEEQAALAANFERFIEVLEADDVRANYRIGITTTDNGNVACSGTTPEAGHLVMSSCRSRTQEFIFGGTDPVDATDEACLDICPPEWSNIDITPTTTDGDLIPQARPWIESIGGRTNLPEGLSTTQAFQCLGPQGVAGCGFESHLESMYLALKRAETDGEASQGFLRDEAILAVVHVTDEADCSENKDQGSAFAATGDKVLWSDPSAGSPTSAVCWNAGVECSGSPDGFDECHSANIGVDGNPVSDEDADALAVLRPVSRYTEYLQSIEERKQALFPDQEVLVALIGGVSDTGETTYAMSGADPKFLDNYGVGPGCTSVAGEAVPPVRLAEFADEFSTGEQNMFSICNDNYSVALKEIAERIKDQLQPSCMQACVADTNPTTEELDPICTLEQTYTDAAGRPAADPIPACGPDGIMPDEETDVCYIGLWDGLQLRRGDGMPGSAVFESITMDDASDDLSPECAAKGYNLEFDIRRRDDVPAPPRVVVAATCQLSQQKAIDCPTL
jgi:hypothetical protein